MTARGQWRRLGELLEARRVVLGYESREQFAEETGAASSRLLYDIEKAKRTNFDHGTLLLIEDAYEWERGSIQQVLHGGDPAPAEKAKGVLAVDRRSPTPTQLRGDIRRTLGRLSTAQLSRVRDFIAGVIDED